MSKFCEVCGHNNLKKVLDLGMHPLCDDLLPIGSKKKNKLYKIKILFCLKCFTAHQKYQVNKKNLFPKKYHYRARFTQDVVSGMKNLVNETQGLFKDLNKKKVLDIGCNDGTLLNFFRDKGCITIGIEPTDAALDASKNKHYIYNEYFESKTVEKLKKKFNKFDIITFTNVFAHIENFQLLINNLKKIVSDETVVIIENHYLGTVLKSGQFDTFYHEHPRTYSLKSFEFIAKLLELHIIKVKFPKRYGGNIRVFLSKKRNNSNLNKKLIFKEKFFLKEFIILNKKVINWKLNKKKLIKKLVEKYGALKAKAFPGRAAILLKILSLNKKSISTVFEKPNSMKVGNYVPGTNIPIKSEKILFRDIKNEKIIINLAWHITKEIREYLKSKGFTGRVVNILDKRDFVKPKN